MPATWPRLPAAGAGSGDLCQHADQSARLAGRQWQISGFPGRADSGLPVAWPGVDYA